MEVYNALNNKQTKTILPSQVTKHASIEKYQEIAEKVHHMYRTTVGRVKRMSGTVHKVIVHGADFIR